MLDEKQKLKEIIQLGNDIAQIQDLDILLEHILTKARMFTNADAGSIYIVDGSILKFQYNQNNTLQKKLPEGKKLIYSTFTVPIDDQTISGYVANNGEMLNIPNVYMIPENAPYSFGARYDELSEYHTTSMLTIPLKLSLGTVVGVLQLINAMDRKGRIIPFSRKDEQYIRHFANGAAVAIERAQMTRTLLLRMISMAELRDPRETGAHVNRVAAYAVAIYEAWARRRGDADDVIRRNLGSLRMAAMLHDVGKVAISDVILKKPAHLVEDEYQIMKQHTFLGARLFNEKYSNFDEAAYLVALNHHERWDGGGYPGYIDAATGESLPGFEAQGKSARGKSREEIPAYGRVVAIADVYDALASNRAYKKAWSEDRVLETMKEETGKHFDPEMMEVFFDNVDLIKAIHARYPEEE
ncbi:MAG: HD domain-containing protein [Deltaproteobacteria bacterium]|nr:HD domain-containing protein [Deltaproteobacteria bacterium]